MQVMYIVNILQKVFILQIIKAPEPLMRRQGFPLVPSQELPTVNAGQAADGEIVGEFLSIAHASRSLKISRRSLSCALSGAQKTAGGYIWEEKMEDDIQVQEQ